MQDEAEQLVAEPPAASAGDDEESRRRLRARDRRRSSTNVLLPAAVGALAGSTRYYQLWYRDPLGPCGNGFNATNGLELTWAP